MIQANNVTVQFGGRVLFERVNVTFSAGNCYGIIGANGAGKSTFLKVLSGELDPQKGEVFITPGERLSVLKQDHFAYDEYEVIRTVIMGNPRLIEVMEEKDALYMKEDFSEEDGIKAGELEAEFADMDGWNAESDAAFMLNKLGVPDEYHYMQMAELPSDMKVKVLLAQALFGNPDILLLDEPTNHLDLSAIRWLENFLMDFENTVIVVSHDRHFLNKVCTHICDVDFGKIQLYTGNYDFWYEYTQMRQRQARDQNKKNEQKIKELQEFIARFSANAAKSKQATSRKKQLDALEMIDMPVSSRRFPYVDFKPDRECGNDLLRVDHLTKTIGDRKVLDDVSFVIHPREKVAFVGSDVVAKTTLFKIIMGELEPDEGSFKWGVTTSQSYFPSDNSKYFDGVELTLVDWLRQYTTYTLEADIRGWLGRMLFSGEEALKMANVLSGGERVRCMLCKMMLSGANVLILDEPTNHLDLDAIDWLEEFLINFDNTVIVVSHDRYFLNKVCTHIADIDYAKIQLYAGNYDFWYESSQLMIKQMKEANKKKEEKIKELQNFIQRFSANASKSKQATSRKHALEKIQLDEMKPSSRKYPYIDFRPDREIGNEVLTVEHISKTIDGVKVLDDISFVINREDKVAFVGSNTIAATTLFQILTGEMEPDEGTFKWGVTTSFSYFPKDNTELFDRDETIVDWLMPFSPEKDPTYVRGFLGRMLFPGEDGVKKVNVLSGGERVRVMLSKMMILGSNVLVIDEPTAHLDMESITALNNGLIKFPGVILFTSQDHQFIQTIANRIMEITPGGLIDKLTTYDEYLESDEMARKRQILSVQSDDED